MTSTVYKSGAPTTDLALPFHLRDPVATPSTVFAFDSQDVSSWPKQMAPLTTDPWVDLLSGGNASFTSPPGWGANGGFTFDGALTNQRIVLPTSSKVAANQKTGFLVILWVRPAAVTGLRGLIGIGGGTATTSQYLMYQDDTRIIYSMNGLLAPQKNGVVAGELYQLAMAYAGDGAGNFTRSSWVNSTLLGATTAAAASIYQPIKTSAELAECGVGKFNGTIYRVLFDDLSSGASAASIVAADYADGVGRFM